MEKFENRIWLSSPTMHGDEMEYIREAYINNKVSCMGENIRQAEKLAAQKLGCRCALALSSGTSALHLALKLAGVKAGDKVFCSDMTFAATVNPVLYEQAIPVFIDAEYRSWNMDPDALERAFRLYPETKVIVVADLYGVPARYDAICEIARRHGAVLVEDGAEALGASFMGKPVGSFGSYNAISFNGNKIITGSAGGMLLTEDAEGAEQARKWANQSREEAPWYQHSELGYNYRMSNVVAGIVRGQFPYLEEHIAQKKAIYQRYQQGFADLPLSMNPFDADTMEPNFWLSCLLIGEEAMAKQYRSDREAAFVAEAGKTCPTQILQLLDSHNAEGRPIWKPMHLQPVFSAYPFVTREEGSKEVGTDLFRRGLCLPSDNKMTPALQDRIIQLVRSCFS